MSSLPPVSCQPIGRVHSPYDDPAGMPIQTAAAPQAAGRIEVFPGYEAGLRDIEGFDYLIVLTHPHRAAHEKLEVTPFLDDRPHGVFATRAPTRPNRLGLSIVRLTGVDGRWLDFAGNDMLDGTPVLDIKPYVPAFDVRRTERVGWFGPRLGGLAGTLSDDRMG